MCSAKTNGLGEGSHRGGMVADITFKRFHFFLEERQFPAKRTFTKRLAASDSFSESGFPLI
jgi:hypothetical protein